MVALERGTNGRFAVGNVGGPGRPRRSVERAYLAAIREAVPLDAWRAIVERAVADAAAGDGKARQWLSHYLIGDVADCQNADEDEDLARGESTVAKLMSIVAGIRDRRENGEVSETE